MDLELLRREIPWRLRQALGARYRGTILFGSRARGDASPDSDIDLLVLLDQPVSLGRDGDAIIHALYPVQLGIDVPLHPVPVAYDSYQAGTFGLYRNAREEGIQL